MKREITGNIILPGRILYGGKVLCENGIIVGISEHFCRETQKLPFVLPGLVDIHNHGGMGHDYMEATQEAFEAISGHLLRHGVTTAQCTTVSAPIEQLEAVFRFFNTWRKKENGRRCRFCGIHIEGPYISHKNKGAHPAGALKLPRDGYDWVLENSDIIREITVAPELRGMPEMIEDLCRAGIVVSGGHDDAEPEDVEEAVEKGMRHCTHIYCAMSTLHKTGLQRRCGLCEYAMTHSEITAEMIADNHHTPPWLAQMIYRCKGADKLCVVSDAIAPGGLNEKEGMFSLGTGENCTQVFVEDGVAVVGDGSCYAGSVQALDSMIRNLVKDADIPLVDAVRMATLTPAGVVRIEQDCGSIAIGKRADFCIMDKNLEVSETIVEGKTVFRKDRDGRDKNSEQSYL